MEDKTVVQHALDLSSKLTKLTQVTQLIFNLNMVGKKEKEIAKRIIAWEESGDLKVDFDNMQCILKNLLEHAHKVNNDNDEV